MTSTAPAIVVATDLSDASRQALESATNLAKDFGARIILVHALEPAHAYRGLSVGAYSAEADTYAATADMEAVRQLTISWAEPVRVEGVEVDIVVRGETPSRLVHEVAKEQGAGMVVVGSHGRSGLGRVILGSVAEQVVRHSDRPVLVVPFRKEVHA